MRFDSLTQDGTSFGSTSIISDLVENITNRNRKDRTEKVQTVDADVSESSGLYRISDLSRPEIKHRQHYPLLTTSPRELVPQAELLDSNSRVRIN